MPITVKQLVSVQLKCCIQCIPVLRNSAGNSSAFDSSNLFLLYYHQIMATFVSSTYSDNSDLLQPVRFYAFYVRTVRLFLDHYNNLDHYNSISDFKIFN